MHREGGQNGSCGFKANTKKMWKTFSKRRKLQRREKENTFLGPRGRVRTELGGKEKVGFPPEGDSPLQQQANVSIHQEVSDPNSQTMCSDNPTQHS